MKIVAKNKRARYDYEILEEIEAGLILTGAEVKSCRMGQANLSGAYVSMHSGKPVLKSATIAPYTFAAHDASYESGRDRQLLLKKRDIGKIDSLLSEKGVAIIPLEIRAGKFIKVLLGIGRGRKRLDKRQRIKEKEMKKRLKKGEEY